MHYSKYQESEYRSNYEFGFLFDKKHSQLKDLDDTSVNRNNNRVCSEEILNLSKNIVENRNTTEKQESSCKIFFGLINQLRHKRKNRLKSISYETENDSVSKTKFKNNLRDFGSYSHIPISSQITNDFCKKEFVFDSHLKKMVDMKSEESSKNIYSYYTTIQSLIQNNQKENSEGIKESKIKTNILKNLTVNQPILRQKSCNLKILNREKRIITEKVYFRRKKTRATQTKIHPYHINLIKYYINNIADFIVFQIVEEYQIQFTVLFFEDVMKSDDDISKLLEKRVLKCEDTKTPFFTFTKVKKPVSTTQEKTFNKNTGFDCLENFDTMEDISNNPSQSLFSNYELCDCKILEKLLKNDSFTQSEDIKCLTNITCRTFEHDVVPPHQDTSKNKNVKNGDCHKFTVFDESSFVENFEVYFSKYQTDSNALIHFKNTKLVAIKLEPFLNNDVYVVHFATKVLTKTSKMKLEENPLNLLLHKNTPSKNIYKDIIKSANELERICKFKVETQILINLEEHVKTLYEKDSVVGLIYDLLDIQESEMEKHVLESYQENIQISEKLLQRNLISNKVKNCKDILKTKCVLSLNKANDRHSLNMLDEMILKMYNSESYLSIFTDKIEDSEIIIIQITAKWSLHRKSEFFSKFHLTMEYSLTKIEKSKNCSSFHRNTNLEENNLRNLFNAPDCFSSHTGLIKKLRSTDIQTYNCLDPHSSGLVSDREPFPIRCGIRSLYRFIFQAWIFQ